MSLWFMVPITIVNGVYKPSYNSGAPHCIYVLYMCVFVLCILCTSIFFSDLRGDGNVLNPKAYRNNKYHKPSPPMPHKKLGGSNVAVALSPTLVYNCNNSGLCMFMDVYGRYIN